MFKSSNNIHFLTLIQHQHAPQSYFKKKFFILKNCSEFEFTSVNVNVTDYLNLKKIAAKISKCKKSDVYIYLFNDGTIIEENDYLINLEEWTELFILKQNQKKKLENYFEVKRFLELECCMNI